MSLDTPTSTKRDSAVRAPVDGTHENGASPRSPVVRRPAGSRSQHRPEIDGLRALAVLPVIFYHAGFGWFSGGFIGVDVFFVISGYLITSIIAGDIAAGRFSVAAFYERRARRILPALFFVMLTCLPFAWAFMNPVLLKRFAQSLVAVSLFASNVLFWQTTDYFDPAAEQKPLLHTWSLGVEEQYYILFPLALLVLLRWGSKRAVWALSIVAICSLLWAEWELKQGLHGAAFFLAHTRAWELLMGSLLALVSLGRPLDERVSGRTAGVLSAVGLLLVVAAVFGYEESTPFPGVYALVPALGTALLLAFARPTTLAGRFLSRRWMVGVGLVSYSAYLWHQPLFAFARIFAGGEPPALAFGLLSVLALALAYFSWRYVEKPFRNRAFLTRTTVFAASAAASLAFVSVGVVGHVTGGFEASYRARLSPENRELAKKIEGAVATGGYHAVVDDGDCRFSDRSVSAQFRARYAACARKYGRSVLIVGDSHAFDLYNAVAAVSDRPFIAGVAQAGCRPYPVQTGCHYENVVTFVERNRSTVATVLYTQSGEYLLRNRNSATVAADRVHGLHAYLRRIAAAVPVIWLGPQPELVADLRAINLHLGPPRASFNPRVAVVDSYLRRQDLSDVTYVSKVQLLNVQPRDLYLEGEFTYSDRDHWSTHGERVFGERLLHDEHVRAAVMIRGAGNATTQGSLR